GAGDVAGVVLILGTGVHQHGVVVADDGVVLDVVEDGGVDARPHDGLIGGTDCTALSKRVGDGGVDLVLPDTGSNDLRSGRVARHSDGRGGPHQFDLVGVLDAPHRADDQVKVFQCARS